MKKIHRRQAIRCERPGSWSRVSALGTRHPEPGARHPAPGIQYAERAPRRQVADAVQCALLVFGELQVK